VTTSRRAQPVPRKPSPIPLTGGRAPFGTRHVVFADALGKWTRWDVAPPAASSERPDGGALTLVDGAFVRWLFAHAGLDVSDYRPETLVRRLAPCLRALRVRSTAEARALLEAEPALTPAAMNAMLLGVTGFFRDTAVFDALATTVLPELRARERPVRIWSVGCSEGAELYSVAILLAEMHGAAGHDLLGTDCRSDAVERARGGIIEPEAVAALPAALRARYVEHDAGTGRPRMVATLRSATRWRTANVLAVPEPGPWDVILCRNVALYLRAGATVRLWRALASQLRPGGLLVVGKAERPDEPGLTLVRSCIYRREAP
jgi:chemotaxis protein methyltransferase CheR